MPYTNLNNYLVISSFNYVYRNWVNSEQTTFLKKQIGARCAFLGLAPASVMTCAIDVIVGVGAGLAAACAGGNNQRINQFAQNHLNCSIPIVASTYSLILTSFILKVPFEKSFIRYEGNGFISGFVINYLENKAQHFYKSKNFLQRHVVTRLTYALMAVSLLVSRAADGVIGVVAAPLSLLTGGYFQPLNNLAVRALQFPGIIDDLFISSIKFINPEAKVKFGS